METFFVNLYRTRLAYSDTPVITTQLIRSLRRCHNPVRPKKSHYTITNNSFSFSFGEAFT
jgi:hypothetical protein